MHEGTNKILEEHTSIVYCVYIFQDWDNTPVSVVQRVVIDARTLRHKRPLCSAMGPSMPNDTPLNHQKQNKIEPAHIPNAMAFVLSTRRREEKMKWSSRCASMITAK